MHSRKRIYAHFKLSAVFAYKSSAKVFIPRNRRSFEHIPARTVGHEVEFAGDGHAAVIIFAQGLHLAYVLPARRPAYAVYVAAGRAVEGLHGIAVHSVTQPLYPAVVGDEQPAAVEFANRVIFGGIERFAAVGSVIFVAFRLVFGRDNQRILHAVVRFVARYIGTFAPQPRGAYVFPFFEVL